MLAVVSPLLNCCTIKFSNEFTSSIALLIKIVYDVALSVSITFTGLLAMVN